MFCGNVTRHSAFNGLRQTVKRCLGTRGVLRVMQIKKKHESGVPGHFGSTSDIGPAECNQSALWLPFAAWCLALQVL